MPGEKNSKTIAPATVLPVSMSFLIAFGVIGSDASMRHGESRRAACARESFDDTGEIRVDTSRAGRKDLRPPPIPARRSRRGSQQGDPHALFDPPAAARPDGPG